jgi:glycine/D-amino acid oxidase-like deaminating enzyme
MPYEPARALWGEQEADVAIVGGGYTGLAAAYSIKRRFPGKRVLVLEAQYIGFGSSGRNSGGVSGVMGHNYSNLKKKYGAERMLRLQRIMNRSFALVEERIQEHGIACDYEKTGRLIVAETERQVRRLEEERRAAEEAGGKVEWLDRNDARDRFGGVKVLAGLRYPEEGIMDPVKFLRGMRRVVESLGVEICEYTRCTHVEPGAKFSLYTPGGCVRAQDIVLATNAYPDPLRLFRHRVLPFYVYNIVTEPLSGPQMDALHLPGRENTFGATNLYWAGRLTSDNRLVFTECDAKYFYDIERDYSHQPGEYRSHYDLMVRKFPFLSGIRMTHGWGGRIGITLDFLPSVGCTGKHGNVHYSAGYNGAGLAFAQLAGQMIAARMAGEKSELTENLLIDRTLLGVPSAFLTYIGSHAYKGCFRFSDRILSARH